VELVPLLGLLVTPLLTETDDAELETVSLLELDTPEFGSLLLTSLLITGALACTASGEEHAVKTPNERTNPHINNNCDLLCNKENIS